MREQSRYSFAVALIQRVSATMPKDVDDKTWNRTVSLAYPWGERKYHPYQAWLKAVKAVRAGRHKLRAWEGLPLDAVEQEANDA